MLPRRPSASHRDRGREVPTADAMGDPAGGREHPRPWWGHFALGEDEIGTWAIGPLQLWVQRRSQEWRLAWQRDASAAGSEVRCPDPEAALPDEGERARVVARSTAEALEVRPALPDRPVVARPREPFRVLAGEEVAIYVTMPVWVVLLTGEERQLGELPTQRLADTWMGPSTIYGELGYAARDSARLHRERLPRRPHLATTRLTLHNDAADALLVERLSLPAPQLGLWWHPEGGLWTESLAVQRQGDGGLADLQLGDGPPADVAGASPVTTPRSPQSRQNLVKALEALLG
jgi:hypothetical protein